ncbi:MAG: 4-alpha-glucanotransferase [Actinomycetales bacterium]|nr:4-alpha-glucanotransferase [Actinomycetales bacterium]
MAEVDIPARAWLVPARRRRWLRRLAQHMGVAVAYSAPRGRRQVSAGAVISVLAALDLPAVTEAQARTSLASVRARASQRCLPPVTVLTLGTSRLVAVRMPRTVAGEASSHLRPGAATLHLEDASVRSLPVRRPSWPALVRDRIHPATRGSAYRCAGTVLLPADLPLGYHTLHIDGPPTGPAPAGPAGPAPAGSDPAMGHVIVTPTRLPLAAAGARVGIMAQLYSVRSRRSQGVGDFTDLAQLAQWAAREGGCDFLLINPVCASVPVTPYEDSPYLPGSRRFLDPLTLDAPRTHPSPPPPSRGLWDTPAGLLDRDRAAAAKGTILRDAHRRWTLSAAPAEVEQFNDFRSRMGEGLAHHAHYMAIAARHGPDWRTWPSHLRSPGVLSAGDQASLADEVDYHCWVQWQCDRQRGQAQRTARDAGMALGIVNDLPVGVHRHGSATWAEQHMYAMTMSVGCPPDAYNQLGQDWDQPPWRPDALRESGYRPFREVVRAMVGEGGGVRIDHILGLFRLWWVPAGRLPVDGTYVTQDHEALVGIAVLEAYRAGALVIGEDLGTYEPWVRSYLTGRGVLGTDVVWFTAPDGDRMPAPDTWRRSTLATVTTHDAPPTAGFLAGEHVRVRNVLGLLTESFADSWRAHLATIDRWRRSLREAGYLVDGPGLDAPGLDADGLDADGLDADGLDADTAMLLAAHRYLAATPAALVCVALSDLTGDRRLQNQPGTDAQYPNWRVPLSDRGGWPVWLDDLPTRDGQPIAGWRLALPVLDAVHPRGDAAPTGRSPGASSR